MKKTAIITGGSSGLGKYLCNNLMSNYNIIDLSRRSINTPCDITNNESIKNIIKNIKTVDLLINNAGVMLFNSFPNITEEEFDITFATNVKGTFLVTQSVLPLMNSNSYIINISSIRGITGCPNKAIYSASKFALQGMTDSLRKESNGVRITNICAGRIPDSVTHLDILKTIKYITSLSNRTIIRDIILGGQL